MADMAGSAVAPDPDHGGGDEPCWAHLHQEPTIVLGPARRAEAEALTGVGDRALVVCDGDGRVLHWNDASQRLFGWAEPEVIGASVDLVWPRSQRTVFWRTFFDELRTPDDAPPRGSVEMVATHRDGDSFTVWIDFDTLWRHDEASPTCLALVITDR